MTNNADTDRNWDCIVCGETCKGLPGARGKRYGIRMGMGGPLVHADCAGPSRPARHSPLTGHSVGCAVGDGLACDCHQ